MQGLPQFAISGLPDAACKQSPDRIKAGRGELRGAGAATGAHRQPLAGVDAQARQRLRPADRGRRARRGGARPGAGRGADVVHLGELGLDGRVRPVRGVLPAVLAAARPGSTPWSCRPTTRPRRRSCPACGCTGARHLAELVGRYAPAGQGRACRRTSRSPAASAAAAASRRPVPDLRDVVGQAEARAGARDRRGGRAPPADVGPPGAGKTMLAERLPGLLPAARPGARPGGDGDPARCRASLPDGPERWSPAHRSSRRTTARRWRRSSAAAAAASAPGRSPGPTAGCSSSTRRRSSSSRVLEALRAAAGVRRGRRSPGAPGGPLPGPVPARARRQPVPVRPRARQGRSTARARRWARRATSAGCPARCSTGSTCRCRCTPSAGPRWRQPSGGVQRRRWPRGCRGPRGAGRAAGRRPPWQVNAEVPGPCCAARRSACRARRPPTSTGRSSGAR